MSKDRIFFFLKKMLNSQKKKGKTETTVHAALLSLFSLYIFIKTYKIIKILVKV